MNIFFLFMSTAQCAKVYYDKHCVKIILEITQMLYTAKWVCDGEEVFASHQPYRKTHPNHPTSKWVRRSLYNYFYACDLGLELCKEYSRRYGKIHKCQERLEWLLINPIGVVDETPYKSDTYLASESIPKNCTRVPLAMPKEFHRKDLLEAYRLYYIVDKQHIPTDKKVLKLLIESWNLPVSLATTID